MPLPRRAIRARPLFLWIADKDSEMNDTTKPSTETLLPCPFCGGEAYLRHIEPGSWICQCDVCGAGSAIVPRGRALNAWNTRPNQSPWKRAEELERALKGVLNAWNSGRIPTHGEFQGSKYLSPAGAMVQAEPILAAYKVLPEGPAQ